MYSGTASNALTGDEIRLTPKAAEETLATVAAAIATWPESAAANGIRASEVARFADAFRLP